MRNLKKVLSLALALVMLLGMMVVGAGAVTTTKDYTDGSGVKYAEAVDVMSAIGVFDGTTTNGVKSFNPQGTLTRAQAAKIITYMLLGKEAAEKLGTLTAPFADVPASNWAAGSIAYCSNMGIVSGVGNNKFNPDGLVTGYQFAKMLLVALGYDAEREGMTGKDWSIAVAKLAITSALDLGVDNGTDIVLENALTREEAAQMAFNTIKATMVEYATNSSTITVGGTPIVIGGSNATKVLSNRGYAKNFGDGQLTGTSYWTLEFGERYFQNLYRRSGTADELGYDAHTWQLGRDDIGTYVHGAAFTYTSKTDKDVVERDLRGYTFGNVDNDGIDPLINNKASSTVTTAKGIADLTGNGVLVMLYANDQRVITKVVVVHTYLMTVKKVADKEVTLSKVNNMGSMTINAVKDDNANFAALSAMKAGDYVLVTPAWVKDNDYNVAAVAVPEVVTGALTRVDKNDKSETTGITLAGTAYSIGKDQTYITGELAFNALTDIHLTANSKQEVSVYLDTYGNVVCLKQVAAVINYMYIIGQYNTLVDGQIITMARGVSTDGTVVEVNAGLQGSANAALAVTGNIVKYTASTATQAAVDKSEFTLTTVKENGVDHSGVATNGTYEQPAAAIAAGATTMTINGVAVPYASNVKFIYYKDGQVTVREGVQKVESGSLASTKALTVNNSNGVLVVATVFIAGEPVDATSKIVYMNAFKSYTTVNNAAASIYEAYIDGEKETITVKGADATLTGFRTYAYDEANNLYTIGAAPTPKASGATSTATGLVSNILDERLITIAAPTSLTNLNATNAKFVNLTKEELDSLADVAKIVSSKEVRVAIIYNNAGGAEQDLVACVYVTSVSDKTRTSTAADANAVKALPDGVHQLSAAPSDITDYGNVPSYVRTFKYTLTSEQAGKDVTLVIDNDATYTEVNDSATAAGAHYFYVRVTSGDGDSWSNSGSGTLVNGNLSVGTHSYTISNEDGVIKTGTFYVGA